MIAPFAAKSSQEIQTELLEIARNTLRADIARIELHFHADRDGDPIARILIVLAREPKTGLSGEKLLQIIDRFRTVLVRAGHPAFPVVSYATKSELRKEPLISVVRDEV